MATSVIQGDLHATGRITAGSLSVPSGAISNVQVASNSQIEATKLQHQRVITYVLGGPASTVTADTKIVHVVKGTGSISSVSASLVTPPTTTNVVHVDLKKGNATTALAPASTFASVLAATIDFDNTSTALTVVDGSVSSPTVAAGDHLEIVVTATGTSAEGLTVSIVVNEAAVM